METLETLRRALMEMFERIRQPIVAASERRRQQVLLAEREAERLDRIRNPSKYLGK